jgi:hypothetical protein
MPHPGGMGRALWVAVIWLSACGGDDPPERELTDDGRVCVKLLPSGAVRVDIVFHDCLTSCDIAQPASCTVTAESSEEGPDILRVTSRGTVKSTGASVCSPNCGHLQASCTSADQLPPGRWSLHHGREEASLTLGSQPQCFFDD